MSLEMQQRSVEYSSLLKLDGIRKGGASRSAPEAPHASYGQAAPRAPAAGSAPSHATPSPPPPSAITARVPPGSPSRVHRPRTTYFGYSLSPSPPKQFETS